MQKCAEFSLEPMGQTTPVFAIGSYQAVERPIIQVSYLGEHRGTALIVDSTAMRSALSLAMQSCLGITTP